MLCLKSVLLVCILYTEYLLGDLNSDSLKVLIENVHNAYENIDDVGSVGVLEQVNFNPEKIAKKLHHSNSFVIL